MVSPNSLKIDMTVRRQMCVMEIPITIPAAKLNADVMFRG